MDQESALRGCGRHLWSTKSPKIFLLRLGSKCLQHRKSPTHGWIGPESQLKSKCCFPSRPKLRVLLQTRNSNIAVLNQQSGTNWPSFCSSNMPSFSPCLLNCSPLLLEHSEPRSLYSRLLSMQVSTQMSLPQGMGVPLGRWQSATSWPGWWLQGCVYFAEIHQAVHLWLVHFFVCM